MTNRKLSSAQHAMHIPKTVTRLKVSMQIIVDGSQLRLDAKDIQILNKYVVTITG
jgi:hypothetical protein